MKIIDAHTHIDYITPCFQQDVVAAVCSARNESDWPIMIKENNSDKNIFCAFGVHPWSIDSVQDGFESRLSNLLKTNRSFMVGEIGLDKYHQNMDKQIDVFVKQLNIAVLLKRSVFLHCVGAWDKILHILKQYKKSELPVIVAHGFNGNDIILQNLLDNYNVYFSFSKIDKPQEMHRIERIQSDRILVETDGKNDIILKDIIDKISIIKNNSDMGNIIYNNTYKVVGNE